MILKCNGVARVFFWGGGTAGGPPDGNKFKNFKRIKVLENESIFQNFQHFACPKTPFFSKKNF